MLTPTLTRDQVAAAYKATHPELGKLLQLKIAPLPVRVERTALWYTDEVETARGAVDKFLARFRTKRPRRAAP